MRLVSHVSFSMRPPKHGWLPVRLELDDFVIDEAASNVLNDPVESLLDLLAFSLAPRSHAARLCLWLEPGGYAIDVSTAHAAGYCLLQVFYEDDFVPPMHGKEMARRFECELETTSLRRALTVGLDILLSDPEAVVLDRWRRDQSLEHYRKRLNSLREAG